MNPILTGRNAIIAGGHALGASSAPKPKAITIRHDKWTGAIDEVVAKGADVHLERMSDGHVWMSITIGDERYDLNLFAEGVFRKRLRMRGEWE